MTEPRGATPADWSHFDFVLGLGAHLLPCVPAAPDVRVVAGSAIEGKVGKIPSMFNRAGEAHGITGWSKRPILGNEVALWSQDPRLNLCVRTGPISGVYAVDVDVDDPNTAPGIANVLYSVFANNERPLYYRGRPSSLKILVPFRMEEPCKKRKIKLDKNPKGSAIELLADGQQFVAAGSHSSGVRYQWLPGLPSTLPLITLDQLNLMWQELTSAYAMVSSPTGTKLDSLTTTLPSSSSSTDTGVLTEISNHDWSDLLAALRFMLDKVTDNDAWSQIGYALLSLQATRPAEQLWLDFSKKAAGFEPGAPEAWWQAHKGQQPRSDYRHIFTIARRLGFGSTSDPQTFPVIQRSSGSDDVVEGEGSDGPDAANAPEGLDIVPAPLDRPLVRISGSNFSEVVAQLEQIIEPHVYTQGASLVRPTEAHTVEEIRRNDDALMLIPVTLAWGRTRFGNLATFERYDGRKKGWHEIPPSSEYISTLLELGGWSTLRPLDAIARAPFVREDGSICERAGYDPVSRTLLIPNCEFPGIPERPSLGDARCALARLRGVFDQFPWKEAASESAFLSHLLSECTRLAVDRCPIFWYTAPDAGTGKGLLSEMASTITHGAEPALRPWVTQGDELRKTLFASLLAGDRSIAFDNVPTGSKTRAPELCAFITSAIWKDRKLGVSETHAVPNKAVVSASGNNITPVSDMARRSIVVRLDANTEKLRERRFKIVNLRRYVLENRPELLTCALTIVKAYLASAASEMPLPLPSFERWSRMAREPLIWLGMADPCITQNETDDERASLGDVFTRIVHHLGDREFTAVDLSRIICSVVDTEGELSNLLMQSGCSEPNSPIKVGYWLRDSRDKIASGLKLQSVGRNTRGAKWALTKVEESLT